MILEINIAKTIQYDHPGKGVNYQKDGTFNNACMHIFDRVITAELESASQIPYAVIFAMADVSVETYINDDAFTLNQDDNAITYVRNETEDGFPAGTDAHERGEQLYHAVYTITMKVDGEELPNLENLFPSMDIW